MYTDLDTSARRFSQSRSHRHALVVCALAGGAPAADPLEDYVQACEPPLERIWTYYNREKSPGEAKAASTAVQVTCSALIDRLSAVSDPTPEQRLALLMAPLPFGDRSGRG